MTVLLNANYATTTYNDASIYARNKRSLMYSGHKVYSGGRAAYIYRGTAVRGSLKLGHRPLSWCWPVPVRMKVRSTLATGDLNLWSVCTAWLKVTVYRHRFATGDFYLCLYSMAEGDLVYQHSFAKGGFKPSSVKMTLLKETYSFRLFTHSC